jgi:hypothetical protein
MEVLPENFVRLPLAGVPVVVTVPPPPPVAAIVIAPLPFVIEIPLPAVSVDFESVFPVEFPMRSCPSV